MRDCVCSPLHEEIEAGIWTPATCTVRQCVIDWLDSLELDPHTMATYRGQAEKWIYPKIGATPNSSTCPTASPATRRGP